MHRATASRWRLLGVSPSVSVGANRMCADTRTRNEPPIKLLLHDHNNSTLNVARNGSTATLLSATSQASSTYPTTPATATSASTLQAPRRPCPWTGSIDGISPPQSPSAVAHVLPPVSDAPESSIGSSSFQFSWGLELTSELEQDRSERLRGPVAVPPPPRRPRVDTSGERFVASPPLSPSGSPSSSSNSRFNSFEDATRDLQRRTSMGGISTPAMSRQSSSSSCTSPTSTLPTLVPRASASPLYTNGSRGPSMLRHVRASKSIISAPTLVSTTSERAFAASAAGRRHSMSPTTPRAYDDSSLKPASPQAPALPSPVEEDVEEDRFEKILEATLERQRRAEADRFAAFQARKAAERAAAASGSSTPSATGDGVLNRTPNDTDTLHRTPSLTNTVTSGGDSSVCTSPSTEDIVSPVLAPTLLLQAHRGQHGVKGLDLSSALEPVTRENEKSVATPTSSAALTDATAVDTRLSPLSPTTACNTPDSYRGDTSMDSDTALMTPPPSSFITTKMARAAAIAAAGDPLKPRRLLQLLPRHNARHRASVSISAVSVPALAALSASTSSSGSNCETEQIPFDVAREDVISEETLRESQELKRDPRRDTLMPAPRAPESMVTASRRDSRRDTIIAPRAIKVPGPPDMESAVDLTPKEGGFVPVDPAGLGLGIPIPPAPHRHDNSDSFDEPIMSYSRSRLPPHLARTSKSYASLPRSESSEVSVMAKRTGSSKGAKDWPEWPPQWDDVPRAAGGSRRPSAASLWSMASGGSLEAPADRSATPQAYPKRYAHSTNASIHTFGGRSFGSGSGSASTSGHTNRGSVGSTFSFKFETQNGVDFTIPHSAGEAGWDLDAYLTGSGAQAV